MGEVHRVVLTGLTVFLSLWLVIGFWPLPLVSQVGLVVLIVFLCASVLWQARPISLTRHSAGKGIGDNSLPPANYHGAVILVCGDSDVLFNAGTYYRESRLGWYLQVSDPEQLPHLVQQITSARPHLISHISILLAVVPERHQHRDEFSQTLRAWLRAVGLCGSWLRGLPPLGTVTWVTPPQNVELDEPLWFINSRHAGIHLHQTGNESQPVTHWIEDSPGAQAHHRLSQALWLKSVIIWQRDTVDRLLSEPQNKYPSFSYCAQGFCLWPVQGINGNLWQQQIASMTTLEPQGTLVADPFPLPEGLLPYLARPQGITQGMLFWRRVGLLLGTFFALAMLTSFVNNQRFIGRLGDHLALYQSFRGEASARQSQARQRLLDDAQQLDDWQRSGEPLSYGMGLYQGLRFVAPIEAALRAWSTPHRPSMPVAQPTAKEPKTVRIDSMSLFDSGKAVLKADSNKMLVNALVDIKAQPGRLIVVAGHTDSSGNVQNNQTLSYQRAEAVRDWMRDIGNIPASCFAVQGHGSSHPVATNDTAEGRALNRRVEIILVPQGDACQTPTKVTRPSPEAGLSSGSE